MLTINIKIPEQEFEITVPDISIIFPELDDSELLQDLETRNKVMQYLKYAITFKTEINGR